MEVVASLSQGRTAAAQCGLFTHKSVPVIFEPPCTTRFIIKNFYVLPTACISYIFHQIEHRLFPWLALFDLFL